LYIFDVTPPVPGSAVHDAILIKSLHDARYQSSCHGPSTCRKINMVGKRAVSGTIPSRMLNLCPGSIARGWKVLQTILGKVRIFCKSLCDKLRLTSTLSPGITIFDSASAVPSGQVKSAASSIALLDQLSDQGIHHTCRLFACRFAVGSCFQSPYAFHPPPS
jgi:hypothetical protein